jgi:hypothetical protein
MTVPAISKTVGLSARQVDVLNADGIDVRLPANQPANDIVVGVLVGRKSQQWAEWLSATCDKPVPNAR